MTGRVVPPRCSGLVARTCSGPVELVRVRGRRGPLAVCAACADALRRLGADVRPAVPAKNGPGRPIRPTGD